MKKILDGSKICWTLVWVPILTYRWNIIYFFKNRSVFSILFLATISKISSWWTMSFQAGIFCRYILCSQRKLREILLVLKYQGKVHNFYQNIERFFLVTLQKISNFFFFKFMLASNHWYLLCFITDCWFGKKY